MKVLLIQHQPHARRLFGHLLLEENVDVVECSTPDEAIELRSYPDLDAIFVEEPTPDGRPREAVQRLRAIDEFSDVVVVALIDRDHRRHISDLIVDGVDDFLIVPAPLEQLRIRLQVILRWIERSTVSRPASADPQPEREERVQAIADAALVLDRQGTIVDVNESLSRLTGYSAEQMIGQPAELIGLPMSEEMPRLLVRVGTPAGEQAALTLVRRDMKPVATQIDYTWLDPGSENKVLAVVTEAPREEVSRPIKGSVTHTEDREPEFLEFDRQGTLRTVTKPLANTLKTSSEELVGTSLRSLIHTDDLARISELMAPDLRDRDASVTGNLRLRSGQDEWVSLRLTGSVPTKGERAERFRLEVVPSDRATQIGKVVGGAHRDALTGLVDRQGLIEEIRLALDRPDSDVAGAVFFLSIDRFKMIQELYGYDIGDEFVQLAAMRLSEIVPDESVVARVGDHEFGILTMAISDEDEARNLAELIADSFKDRPIRIGEIERTLTFKIGICNRSSDCADPAEVLRRADKASMNAMATLDSNVAVYDPRLEEVSSDSMLLEQELLNAVRRNEFVVYYQPEVDLLSGAIVGVEALVRWNHPNGRILTPSKFIPTAEEVGIINQIGLWVLEEAARDAMSWMADLELPKFTLSVNFSPLQFQQSQLVSEVMAVLRRSGLAPSNLRIEITESVLIDDQPELLKRIAQLRKLGATLAIDDFGTGHASISSLRTLPVSYVKVDRSFVSGAVTASGELSLTRSIATLAQDSGLDVVVEGIETAEQLQRVREYGCVFGQGFFFSRPVDAETVRFLLSAGPTPFAELL